jgi:hypothetical protein
MLQKVWRMGILLDKNSENVDKLKYFISHYKNIWLKPSIVMQACHRLKPVARDSRVM